MCQRSLALALPLLAVLPLAGCENNPLELALHGGVRREVREARFQERQAAFHRQVREDPDLRAQVICRARGQQVRNLHAGNGRSLLELDAIAAGNQTARQCFEVYQATGTMPTF